DIGLLVGYEYLPDWNYNPWRPRGIGYVSLSIPTGRSVYQSTDKWGLDASGKGLWGLGIGTALIKAWGIWDVGFQGEVHRFFSRTFENSQGNYRVQPGFGTSAIFQGGVSFSLPVIGLDSRLGG